MVTIDGNRRGILLLCGAVTCNAKVVMKVKRKTDNHPRLNRFDLFFNSYKGFLNFTSGLINVLRCK